MVDVASDRCDRVGEVLLCGGEPWDADIHRATVETAAALVAASAIALPASWSLGPALRRPLQNRDLARIVPDLIALKKLDRWTDESYPERQATLAIWTLTFEPWPMGTRCGVAWSSTMLGMDHHHFALRPGQEAIRLPSAHFFNDYPTVDTLAALLRRTYVDTRADDLGSAVGWT